MNRLPPELRGMPCPFPGCENRAETIKTTGQLELALAGLEPTPQCWAHVFLFIGSDDRILL